MNISMDRRRSISAAMMWAGVGVIYGGLFMGRYVVVYGMAMLRPSPFCLGVGLLVAGFLIGADWNNPHLPTKGNIEGQDGVEREEK